MWVLSREVYIVSSVFQLHVTQGIGRFVPMPCNAEQVFGRIWARDKVRVKSMVSVIFSRLFQFTECI